MLTIVKMSLPTLIHWVIHLMALMMMVTGNKKHDRNGNRRPDKGEPNVDEDDESRIQRKPVSLFPIIPTIGITWNF